MIPLPFVALLGAGAIWCLIVWIGFVRAESSKTEIELRQERINEELRREHKRSLADAVRARLAEFGWEGSLTPLLTVMTFVYMGCAVGLTFIGIDGVLAVILALPFSLLVAAAATTSLKARRQRAFAAQLVQALDLFAANLKAGTGPSRAIEQVLPSLPEPLRTEMARALAQHRASRPLADAVDDIAVRYPSAAMRKFVAVLRIDEERGGEMAPALEEAANSVRRDFELTAEASAEIAQERMQFFGIVGIISAIALYMFTKSDPTTQEAMRSPLGIVVLGVFVANFVLGIFRVLRMLNKAKGGL